MAEENKKSVEKEVKKPVEKTEEKKQDKKSESAVQKAEKADVKTEKKTVEKKEEKAELEREYVIPLRRNAMKVPRYKRAKKAVKAIKEFLAKHMKVEDRDTRKVKVNMYLNNEVWFRGIKKPPAKIKVKAIKKDGIVYAELAEVPEKVKFDMAKHAKFHKAPEKADAPSITPAAAPSDEGKEVKTLEEKTESKEGNEATKEAAKTSAKEAAKTAKHTSKGAHKQKSMPVRKTLKK